MSVVRNHGRLEIAGVGVWRQIVFGVDQARRSGRPGVGSAESSGRCQVCVIRLTGHGCQGKGNSSCESGI